MDHERAKRIGECSEEEKSEESGGERQRKRNMKRARAKECEESMGRKRKRRRNMRRRRGREGFGTRIWDDLAQLALAGFSLAG